MLLNNEIVRIQEQITEIKNVPNVSQAILKEFARITTELNNLREANQNFDELERLKKVAADYAQTRDAVIHDQLIANAQKRNQQQGSNGKNRFSDIHIIAEDRIQLSEFKNAAKKISCKKRKSGGVRPKDGKIGKRQEPGRQKAVVMPKNLPGIGIRPACLRIAVHHIGIVPADQEHYERAEDHAECTAPGAGLGKISIAGYNKRSPPDARSKGKCPCSTC